MRSPGNERFFGVVINFGAKATAHVRAQYPHLVLGNAQHKGTHQQANQVRILGGGVERVLIAHLVVLPNVGARLDGIGYQPLVHKFERGDVGRLTDGLIHFPQRIAQFPVEGQVAGGILMHQRGTFLRGLHGVGDGGQIFPFYFHGFGGIYRGGVRSRQ